MPLAPGTLRILAQRQRGLGRAHTAPLAAFLDGAGDDWDGSRLQEVEPCSSDASDVDHGHHFVDSLASTAPLRHAPQRAVPVDAASEASEPYEAVRVATGGLVYTQGAEPDGCRGSQGAASATHRSRSQQPWLPACATARPRSAPQDRSPDETFSPRISASARRRPPRSVHDMSLGDAEAREARIARRRALQEVAQSAECTFRPALTAPPRSLAAVGSKLAPRRSAAFIEMHRRRVAERAAAASRAVREREVR